MAGNEQNQFIAELEAVSPEVAAWAKAQFAKGNNLDQVKAAVRKAMNICGRAA